MEAAASPPTSIPRSKLAAVRWILKLFYALASGGLCVWIASFMPAEGPPIDAFIPQNAIAILKVRDGAALLRDLPQSRVVQELLNDPDIELLYGVKEAREKI